MAYPCGYNTQSDEDSRFAQQINYFSNPAVDYLGVPTGTSGENNAQIIRDNMVRPVLPLFPAISFETDGDVM